jgi:hypothetical protein
LATTKKSTHADRKTGATELSRLLNEHLKSVGCSKTEIIHTMRPLRKTQGGKDHPAGKYFIKVAGGGAVPDFDYLLEIVGAVTAKSGRELTPSEVTRWLTAWLQDYLQKYPKPSQASVAAKKRAGLNRGSVKLAEAKSEAGAAFVKRAVASAAGWRREVDVGGGIDRIYPPTLVSKDYLLHNCVVIVGASVRHPPSSTGHLFRQNAQLTDLIYLPHLNCGPDPLMLTDNMVIALEEEDRRKLLGEKHLLVIGGPIVNVATRYLNNGSIFPFCFSEQKKKFDNIFDTVKELPSLRNSRAVGHFYEMLKRPAAEVKLDSPPFTGRDVKRVRDDVEKFREVFGLDDEVVYDDILGWLTDVQGLFDPLLPRIVKSSRREPNLGVISLGKNLWADDPHYVCVTVAGFNPEGTVGALRALVYSTFINHPCGGILNAALPQESSEFMRFTDAEFHWVTEPYSVTDLKSGLDRIQRDNRTNRPAYCAFHGDERHFNEYSRFVKSFDG